MSAAAVRPVIAAVAVGALAAAIGCGSGAAPTIPDTRPAPNPDLTARAEGGDPRAMVELAELYRIDPAYQDQAKAIAWYTQAAVKGHSGAMLALGRMYRVGDGLHIDPAQARQWLQKAAADQPLALYHLGEMQRLGEGAPANRDEAAKLYRAAIQARNVRPSTVKLATERLQEMGVEP